MTFANSIYLCYECKWDEKNTNDIHVKKLTWWGICPAAIHVIPIKRLYIYKKTIYDIGTEILKFQCLNCFKTPLFCKSIIPEDSKISRRDLSFPSVKSRFKAIFKKCEFFDLVWNLLFCFRFYLFNLFLLFLFIFLLGGG